MGIGRRRRRKGMGEEGKDVVGVCGITIKKQA